MASWIRDKTILCLAKLSTRHQALAEGRLSPVTQTIVKEVTTRLELLIAIGLDFLSLNRRSSTLSGGDVINIDQSPIGRSSRSNPATYIGFYDKVLALAARADNTGFAGTAISASATVTDFEVRVPDSICEIVEWLPCGQPGSKRMNNDFTGACRAFLQSHGHAIIDWHKGPLFERAERFHAAVKSLALDPHQLTAELQSAWHILALSWHIGVRRQVRKKAKGEAIENRFHIPAQLGRVGGPMAGAKKDVCFLVVYCPFFYNATGASMG